MEPRHSCFFPWFSGLFAILCNQEALLIPVSPHPAQYGGYSPVSGFTQSFCTYSSCAPGSLSLQILAHKIGIQPARQSEDNMRQQVQSHKEHTASAQLTAHGILLTMIKFQLKNSFWKTVNYGRIVLSLGYDAICQVVTYPSWI